MRYSAFLIAFFTTIVRYYDYALFGLSASILAKEFMPQESSEEQLVKFFLVFSIAVIFRPLGSIIFGNIGDNYGRGKCIKISSFLGTIATGTICFLPSYSRIGSLATFGLLLCRTLFIMSLAGEADAIKVYVREKAAKKNRNLTNGFISCCSQIGALLAAFAFYTANKYSFEENSIALWRINFVLGSIGGWIIIYFRQFWQESEEFLRARNQNQSASKDELINLMKSNKLPFLFSIIINGACGGIYHFLIIFWPTFSFKVLRVIDQAQLSKNSVYFIFTYGLCALLSGYLADRVSAYKQISIALLLSVFVLVLIIWNFDQSLIMGFSQLLIILVPFYVSPLQIIVQSMFVIEIRMRLYSLSHSIGAMLFSSTTPLICSLLWKFTGKIQIIFGFLELLTILLTTSFFYLWKKDFFIENKC